MGIEDTLVIIKNPTIERGLIGKIIQKFEEVGLQIVGMKMLKPNEGLARKHYQVDQEWKEKIGAKMILAFQNEAEIENPFGTSDVASLGHQVHEWIVAQLTDQPVIVMVLRGPGAVEKVKIIIGESEPVKADLSTIRGSFSTDSYIRSCIEKRALNNVVHRATSKEEAEREINVWFQKKIYK